MRIGVIGGSFDPIHRGHLEAASAAANRLSLDRVYFSPTGQSWHKDSDSTSSADQRWQMVRLALDGHESFIATRVDLDRPGPTYTVDTLSDLRAQRAVEAPGARDDWFFITGADALASLPSWREPGRIAELAQIVGVTRPGQALAQPHVPGLEATLIEIPGIDVSSRDIRARVARGEAIDGLVPDAVAQYIAAAGLYRPAPA